MTSSAGNLAQRRECTSNCHGTGVKCEYIPHALLPELYVLHPQTKDRSHLHVVQGLSPPRIIKQPLADYLHEDNSSVKVC